MTTRTNNAKHTTQRPRNWPCTQATAIELSQARSALSTADDLLREALQYDTLLNGYCTDHDRRRAMHVRNLAESLRLALAEMTGH